MTTSKPKIVIIGAGNLATSIAVALKNVGEIVQIYSRTEQSARTLAERIGANFTTTLSDLYPTADLYLYAVKDDALQQVINSVPTTHGIHAHTGGCVSMAVFDGKQPNHGVFYPFMAFSKQRIVDFSEISIFVEGSNVQTVDYLTLIGKQIGKNVYKMTSEERSFLHIAGVFANNFPNILWNIAEKLLATKNLPFDVLLPVIRESVRKLEIMTPHEAQSGPASRRDQNTMDKHLQILSDKPEAWQTIYKLLSDEIIKNLN